MDELTLRLECLRCACQARTSPDVLSSAKSYLDWVTNMGKLVPDDVLGPATGPSPRVPLGLKRANEIGK